MIREKSKPLATPSAPFARRLKTGKDVVARAPVTLDVRPERRLTTLPEQGKTPFKQRVVSAFEQAVKAEADHGLGFLFLPVAIGIGAGLFFLAPENPWPLALAIGFGLTALLAVLAQSGQSTAAWVPTLIAAMFAGALAAAFETRDPSILLDSDVTTQITGWVEAREFDEKGRVRYLVALTQTSDPEIRRPPEKVRLVARAAHEPAPLGALITGRARLSSPSGPVMPGGYDFAFRAFVDGIGANGFFFKAPQRLEAQRGETGIIDWLGQNLRDTRERIAGRIRKALPGDAGGIAAALAVSDRRGIGDETVNALRATGLAHILAISGLHMALAAGTLFVGLRLLMAGFPVLAEAMPVKKIAAIGALLAASAYLVISGGSVTTQRAWVMLSIMLVAVLFDRPALTMRNVALAAIVIILFTPSAVVGPGFQMSFAATAALIAAYAVLSQRVTSRAQMGTAKSVQMVPNWLRALARAVLGLAITSLVAGLSTGLFSAHHFHRIAGNGLVANLLAMPLVTLIVMPSGLAAMLLMPLGLDGLPLQLMGVGLKGVIFVAHYVNDMGGDFIVGKIPFHATATAGLGFVILVFLRSRLRLAGGLLIALGFVMALPPFAPDNPDLLVSEDGRLVALVGSDYLASNAARPSAFVFNQWQTALKGPDHLPPLTHKQDKTTSNPKALLAPLIAAAERTQSQFQCASRGLCVALHKGARIIAIDKPKMIGPACDNADLVIISVPLRMKTCRSGATLITARSLRRTGALAISIADKIATSDSGKVPQMASSSEAKLSGLATDNPQAAFSDLDPFGYQPEFAEITQVETSPNEMAENTAPDIGQAGNSKTLSANQTPHAASPQPTAAAIRPSFHIERSIKGIVRPWTIQRYYDWRSRRFDLPD